MRFCGKPPAETHLHCGYGGGGGGGGAVRTPEGVPQREQPGSATAETMKDAPKRRRYFGSF